MDPAQATTQTITPPPDQPTATGDTRASQGANLIAATVEPPPHESTRVEVTELKDPEVKDFGWNSPPRQVPAPLVQSLSNEDLFTLIRRFNKVRLLKHWRNRMR